MKNKNITVDLLHISKSFDEMSKFMNKGLKPVRMKVFFKTLHGEEVTLNIRIKDLPKKLFKASARKAA